MRYYTHLLFGLFLGILFLGYFDNSLLFLSVVIVSSLLPDIDTLHSFVGKRLPPLSFVIYLLFGHRRFFHSLICLGVVAFLISFFHSTLALGFLIGYSSHLFLDALTPEGIWPLFPFHFKIKGFIRTGSFFEHIFFVFLVFLVLFTLITGHRFFI